jgi:RNA-directed DNA polymerase
VADDNSTIDLRQKPYQGANFGEGIDNVINLQPRYVLDADIASCFDKIDQAALLEKMATSPFFARPIRQWLKAGVVDQETFMPTQEGTPQGGVLTLLTKLRTHC